MSILELVWHNKEPSCCNTKMNCTFYKNQIEVISVMNSRQTKFRKFDEDKKSLLRWHEIRFMLSDLVLGFGKKSHQWLVTKNTTGSNKKKEPIKERKEEREMTGEDGEDRQHSVWIWTHDWREGTKEASNETLCNSCFYDRTEISAWERERWEEGDVSFLHERVANKGETKINWKKGKSEKVGVGCQNVA